MKYFFIVQGEGMGHTTQSLALRSLLEKNGHEVARTFLGRRVPLRRNLLYQEIQHNRFLSPFFLSSRNQKGISLTSTFLVNIILSPLYIISILRIAYQVRRSDADAVVVFYDFIGQLGAFFSFSDKKIFSVSHHFFFSHPAFTYPKERKAERLMMNLHSFLASIAADKKLALSFSREKNIPERNLFIVPPLLRPAVLEAGSHRERHFHVYLLHHGFIKNIENLALRYPEITFRIFTRKGKEYPIHHKNIEIETVSQEGFVSSIAGCSAVICTSGFETLAEAIYLNKELYLLPSKSHFEQHCNALDAERIGAATVLRDSGNFVFDAGKGNSAHGKFLKWIGESEAIFMKILCE
ncbi:MAG: hypothetical protein H6538_00275 [Bacteroidales bacterium]|nr:hypothetical protein [Bacteroidales bacterium]MCB8998654.1 hypothetical protein [Bacteroidales bacterium]MCB9012478.1 hypothetical protein [Bacteroidales bacterium]